MPRPDRAALVLVLSALAPAAAAARPQQTPPAAESFRLGADTVTPLRDAENVLDNDGKVFGIEVGPAKVAEVLAAHGAPASPIVLAVDGLLVRGGGRVMLFDAGLGPKARGALVESLAAAGVRPAEVTDVFITHGHFDHVGGLVGPDGGSEFPRAAVHISRREWDSLRAQPSSAALVAAVGAQVRPFEPGGEIVPGVRALALYGHTPGHVGYEITSEGRSLTDAGDVAHSSILSLARPDWAIQYDADRSLGESVRRAELEKLAASGALVFFPHFPYPGLGRVVREGEGFAWRPVSGGPTL